MIHDFSTPKGLSSVSHIISLLGSSIPAKSCPAWPRNWTISVPKINWILFTGLCFQTVVAFSNVFEIGYLGL